MRICIIGSRGFPYVYSGYETLVSELSVRLVQKGHSVTVYCHRALFPERPEKVSGVELRYIRSIERKSLSQFSHSFLCSLSLLKERPDAVLYVNSANGPFGVITRIAGIPSAINVDGLEWLRPKWKGLGARYFRVASWLATKVFDLVIADSVNMAKIYADEFGAVSTVIAYGAPLLQSKYPNRLKELGLEPGSYYLVVGRLVPDNNAELILRGYEKTKTSRKLVIVGGVPYTDRYAQCLQETADARVIFPGYVRDRELLQELYCNCHAYLHGHEFGGTNPALLSALGCGCAVFALDTVFNREVLADGVFGRFFTKDPEMVRSAIERAETCQEEMAGLRMKAQSRILEAYTWEKITDQYEEALMRIAARRSE